MKFKRAIITDMRELVPCPTCDGTGALVHRGKRDSFIQTCSRCKGEALILIGELRQPYEKVLPETKTTTRRRNMRKWWF